MIQVDPNAMADPNVPKKTPQVQASTPLPVTPRTTPDTPLATPVPLGNDAVNAGALPVTPPAPAAAQGPLGGLGPKPITTADNWKTADATGAAWQGQHDAAAASHIASLGPIAGDDGTLSQDAYSQSIGKVKSPSGSWEWPEDLASSQFALAHQVDQNGNAPSEIDSKTGLLKPPSALPVAGSSGADIPMDPYGGTGSLAALGTAQAAMNLPVTSGDPNARTNSAAITGVGASSTPLTTAPQDRSAALPVTAQASPAAAGGALPVTNDPRNANNPAGVDRIGLAKSNLDNFVNASDPYFQKSLRDANSAAAGAGQLGSGQLRTSLGDLAYNRDLRIDSAGKSFLNDATSKSIDDAYRNYDESQQDQGTAFNQSVKQTEVEEALRQGDFSRAIQLLGAGELGNPSGAATTLSNNYGTQATDAGNAAAGLAKNATANSGGSGLPEWLEAYLTQNQGGGGDLSALLGGTPQIKNTQPLPVLPPIDTQGYGGPPPEFPAPPLPVR